MLPLSRRSNPDNRYSQFDLQCAQIWNQGRAGELLCLSEINPSESVATPGLMIYSPPRH
jgi:hypothetical protein